MGKDFIRRLVMDKNLKQFGHRPGPCPANEEISGQPGTVAKDGQQAQDRYGAKGAELHDARERRPDTGRQLVQQPEDVVVDNAGVRCDQCRAETHQGQADR
jgi:hypothetical protein